MIQVRNVPDRLHRELKARAALAGVSLSDFILGELRRVAERPTMAEIRDRLSSRYAVSPSISAAQIVREDRDAR